MSSDVIFLQAKWSKIKERVEGWKSGKKMWFKRITVCSGTPFNRMLEGGDKNTMLGMESTVGLMLLRSKLILLSPAPHPIQC